MLCVREQDIQGTAHSQELQFRAQQVPLGGLLREDEQLQRRGDGAQEQGE